MPPKMITDFTVAVLFFRIDQIRIHISVFLLTEMLCAEIKIVMEMNPQRGVIYVRLEISFFLDPSQT